MNAKQLLFFKRTAELENMTKAAEDLLISQPFLSRVLSELEAEIGVELFDHVGRRIVLNPCGKAFYKRVVNIFNEVDDAVKEVRDLKQSQLTKLSIVTNVSLYMPELLKLLSVSNPDLVISQYSASRNKIEKMMQNGGADFAICCPPLERNPDLVSIELRTEYGVLIYPKGHWLENVDSVNIKEIENEPFISVQRGYGTRDVIDTYIQRENFSPRILIETSDTSSVFKYVSQGLGIGFVPYSQVLHEPEFMNNYTRLDNDMCGKIELIWRRSQYISDAGKQFIEKSKEYFGSLENLK